MGRMECYKRDAHHVGKHSRSTPRLAHIINYLFVYLFTYLVSARFSFSRALASFRLFSNNYFEFTVLCWNASLVNVATETFEPCSFRKDWIFRA